MSKSQNTSRNELDMGSDISLQERIQKSANFLMRSKGKYRERLIDVALELEPLLPKDFTERAGQIFKELKHEVGALRSDINIGFGHFHDPTPSAKTRVAKLMLTLLKACAVAEAKYDESVGD